MDKLLLTDKTGHVMDVFQLDRYDLDSQAGQEQLAADIEVSRITGHPQDWIVRPDLGNEVVDALELADFHLRNPQAERKVKACLHKLRQLGAYQLARPDEQRRQLIDEMALTAKLSTQLADLVEVAFAAINRIKEVGLAYDEFDRLIDLMASLESDAVPEPA